MFTRTHRCEHPVVMSMHSVYCGLSALINRLKGTLPLFTMLKIPLHSNSFTLSSNGPKQPTIKENTQSNVAVELLKSKQVWCTEIGTGKIRVPRSTKRATQPSSPSGSIGTCVSPFYQSWLLPQFPTGWLEYIYLNYRCT